MADAAADPSWDDDTVRMAGSDVAPDPWADAEAQYPGLALWLEVDGVGIATPVMQATEDSPEWFLNHDAHGNESANGIPYLDVRCSTESRVETIYAHNLGWGASEGFGSLADAWQPDTFHAIGDLRLASHHAASTGPDADPEASGAGTSVRTYHPFCALKVAPDDPDVVCYDDDEHQIERWLASARQSSSAFAEDLPSSDAAPRSIVTLVTCSGDGYPSQSRTVVIFIESTSSFGLKSQESELG